MIGVAPPAYDPATPKTANTLPVGATATVRPYVAELFRRHRWAPAASSSASSWCPRRARTAPPTRWSWATSRGRSRSP